MDYIFFLTNSCNLNCKYCYQKNKINKSIDMNIINKLLTEEAKSNSLNTNVSFFGGEPLLQKPILYDTVNLCKELEKRGKHKFTYSVATNATLIDDDFIHFCKTNKVAVGISIDGDEYSHNLNRCDFEGKGSFERTQENTKKCISANLNLMALPVICVNNVEYLSSNIQYLINLGFKQFTCNFNYLDQWDDDTLKVFQKQIHEVTGLYYQEFKKGNYIRIYPLDTKMYFHIYEEKCGNNCNGNHIVIDADGIFYPCLQYVGDSRFKIGNYQDGIDYQKKKELMLKRITAKVVCEECSLKDRCLYQCGCTRLMTTNDIVEVSPLVCETERIMIEEADQLANKLYTDFKDTFLALNY